MFTAFIAFWQVWGPSSTERGLGGSEEAATYLSRELVKREFCVVVFGNPPYEVRHRHPVSCLSTWICTQEFVDDCVARVRKERKGRDMSCWCARIRFLLLLLVSLLYDLLCFTCRNGALIPQE